MPISIPKDHKNAKRAEATRLKLEKAGVDPSVISDIIGKILAGIDVGAIVNLILALLKKK